MKRPRKFFKHKEILRRVREANIARENVERYYFTHEGYRIRYVLSRKGKKHPLGKELNQILPLVAPTRDVDKPEVGELELLTIKKDLYQKLSSAQKQCFRWRKVPSDEFMDNMLATNSLPKSEDYELDPCLADFIVPILTKKYEKLWCGRIKTPAEKKMHRDNIWAYVNRHDRECSKLGRKAKHKKALIKHNKEEIQDLL